MKKIKIMLLALLASGFIFAENTDLKYFIGKWENTIDKGSYTSLTISPVEGSSSSASIKFHFISSGSQKIKGFFQKKATCIFDQDKNIYLYIKFEKQGKKFTFRLKQKSEDSPLLLLEKIVSTEGGEAEKEYLYFRKQIAPPVHSGVVNPHLPHRTHSDAQNKKCEIKGFVSGSESARKSAVVVVEKLSNGMLFFGDINAQTGRYKIKDLEQGKYKLQVLGNNGSLDATPVPSEKTFTLKQNSSDRIKVQNITLKTSKPIGGRVCISYSAYSQQHVSQYILILHNNQKEYVERPVDKTFTFENVKPGTYTLYSDCKSCLSNLSGEGKTITVTAGKTVLLDLSSK